jgi:type II secretory pathway pseudopilin PulG
LIGNHSDDGYSVVDAVVVLCLVATISAFAVPSTISAKDEGRVRQAAAFVATRLRDAKQQAVLRSASAGMVFDRIGQRWTFRLCVDGNGNGLRRADLSTGRDVCPDGPVDLAVLFPGVTVAIDDGIRGPDDDPPSADPVRFGSSDTASFSAAGGCTAGSLFLRSARGVQYAVRVAGTTGRLRVLRYDAAARRWREQ